MQVVVGLGNPGGRYRQTRHNVGFMVLDLLAERGGLDRWKRKFKADYGDCVLGGSRLLLVKPRTYMNLSGASVRDFLGYFHLDLARCLAVVDDMNLPLGRLRLRRGGSHGGHKGLRSITAEVGGSDFPRLRIGIGRPEGQRDAISHVLGRFQEEEREALPPILQLAAEAVLTWSEEGIDAAMNRYNASPEADG